MSRWIRSAFWTGTCAPATEAQFRRHMDLVLMPGMRALPGVASARALWPSSREDDPPALACQVLVEFASRADLERMLASPERAAMRPKVAQAKAMFVGQLSHIDYEVGGD